MSFGYVCGIFSISNMTKYFNTLQKSTRKINYIDVSSMAWKMYV